jgi:LuxR family quorum sensing-dependent transcriptional regulator
MVVQRLPKTTDVADMLTELVDYASRIEELRTPKDVLDQLHEVVSRHLPLFVLGAARFPLAGNWDAVEIGKSAFLHETAPEGWWDEYSALAQGKFRPLLFLAETSLAPYTWTEVRRMFQPIGIEKWTYELALRHGMRDGFTCPVGGRWVVAFWSRKELSNLLTSRLRVAIYAAVNFAALRLEQLAELDPSMVGARTRLTPRELAVLRLVSTGTQFRGIAHALHLGEETIRSHLKKAQGKLGAHNRTQAVAEALRQRLIP